MCLVGDIGLPHVPEQRARLETFLHRCGEMFDQVFYVAGNHEYYNNTVSLAHTDALLTEICAAAGANVRFLQRTSLLLSGTNVRVLGATLWSSVQRGAPMIERYLNDYHKICGLDGAPLVRPLPI